MTPNAKRQLEFRTRMRNMVRYGASVAFANRIVIRKCTQHAWNVVLHWPDYGYYKIERTYSAHGRDYTKSHLISQKVLETNYVETSAKAA